MFFTHPRISVTFSLKLVRTSSNIILLDSDPLLDDDYYSDQDLNTFFHFPISKPISSWLLSAEQEMLRIYSTVHRHLTEEKTQKFPHLRRFNLNNSSPTPLFFIPVMKLLNFKSSSNFFDLASMKDLNNLLI